MTKIPLTARAGAAVAGMSADFIGKTGDAGWADITNIKDGKYIYSFRGTTSVLDRLSLNGGTSGVPTWEVVTYQPSLTTWATGTSTCWSAMTPNIYIVKEGSTTVPQRVYSYSVVGNTVKAISSDWYLGGAALLGNKVWIRSLSNEYVIRWLHVLQSTSTNCRRIMLF